MKGPKIFVAVLVGGALLASAAPAGAGAAAFRHYAACGVAPKSEPSHSCPARAMKGAYFKSPRADVRYGICVDFPRGKTLCAKGQKATRGTLYVNRITSTLKGRHTVTWYVRGKRVGFFAFRVT